MEEMNGWQEEGGFDPLEPITFDPDELEESLDDEKSYYTDPVPPIASSMEEAAAARRAAYPVPELSREERIAKTLKGLPGQKKLLLHTIDWCREERADTDIVAEIVAFERGGVVTYSPESLIAALVRCEALVQTNAPTAEGEGDDGGEGGEPEAAPAPLPADALDAPDEPTEGDAPEYLEVDVPEPARYIATPEGLAAVEAEDPAARFAEFMDANAGYAPVFKTVLQVCDREGGCTKKDIDALVDHDPLCLQPRRFSGYFIDKLEDADAIVFQGTWRTTDIGRAMLAPDGVIGAL